MTCGPTKRNGKSYYIASGLENAAAVRALKTVLDAEGWHHTYDWTVHGAVSVDRLPEVSAEGVWMADVVIVLLPGGRGTHTELGIAIGMVDPVVFGPDEDRMRIVVYSANPGDFEIKGQTCAFYHHPCVERFTSMDEMIDSLLKVN